MTVESQEKDPDAPQKTPPNYRLGNEQENCGNCGSFQAGWCWMFNTPVSAGKTCDDWNPAR